MKLAVMQKPHILQRKMENFINDLASPHWWFGVVLVGILINISAAYTKPLIDKFFSSISKKIKFTVDTKNEERDWLVEKLRRSQEERYIYQLEAIEERLNSIYVLLIGIMLIILSQSFGKDIPIISTFTGLFSLLIMFSSFRGMVKYHKMRLILFEARLSIKKQSKKN